MIKVINVIFRGSLYADIIRKQPTPMFYLEVKQKGICVCATSFCNRTADCDLIDSKVRLIAWFNLDKMLKTGVMLIGLSRQCKEVWRKGGLVTSTTRFCCRKGYDLRAICINRQELGKIKWYLWISELICHLCTCKGSISGSIGACLIQSTRILTILINGNP